MGTYFFSNGEKYEGDFADNRFHGYGVYYFKDGSIYAGLWEKGKKNTSTTVSYTHLTLPTILRV